MSEKPRQNIEYIKSFFEKRFAITTDQIEWLISEVEKLQAMLKIAEDALSGALTYDPMIDRYKLKQYFAYTLKPALTRISELKGTDMGEKS